LGDGQWNIPELRVLLEKILPQHTVMNDYEVQQDFSGLGRASCC
jgi:chemotaxis protein methyltransferase CheR